MAKNLTDKEIETALKATGGFMSVAARKLNVTRKTLYCYINKSDYLINVREEIRESFLDLAESKLIENVKANDNASIFFYLKCQGKKRGYIERQEITGKDGVPLGEKSIKNLTDAELLDMYENLKKNKKKT